MKLLFVHERFGAFAGAESNIFATATELRRRGHTLGILHGPATGKGETKWQEVFEDRFPIESDGSANTKAALQSFQPDVIYVHKLNDLDIIETLLEAKVPLVRMVHDHDLYCMRSYKYNYVTRRICERATSPYCVFPCGAFLARDHERRPPFKWVSYTAKLRELELNRQFDSLLVAGHFMKQELTRNGFDPTRIEIHPPVPPLPEDGGSDSSFSERNLIIYAGQIVRGKGVDVLLESLAQVSVPFECFLFGDGNHRAHCERLSRRLGLEGRVHFKGYVSQDVLKTSYADASLSVLSSVWPEPFGAVGLEAMSHGLPVVAFDAGGIREWLINGYNGYRVPWMDRAAFAARVQELLTNKALARKMGEKGRTMLEEQYSFSDYIDGLEAMFARFTDRTSHLVNA